MKASFLFFLLAFAAGCSTVAGESSERRVVYACNYGPNLTVEYGPYVARIESPDGTVMLRQRGSSPDFWYESATHSLHVSGDEITYQDRQMAPRHCRATS